MKLRNSTYTELAKRVKEKNSRIVIYGAGMIGLLVVPYILKVNELVDYVDFYIDRDVRKIGQEISVGERKIEIKQLDFLHSVGKNTVILLANSRFYPIIEYLDTIRALDEVECYIIPIMQLSEQQELIPKKIHYCWFGGAKIPDFLEKCMESWRVYCPDYEIVRWDETNYDVYKYTYTKQAYENKQYGFVSDVARLDILYEYGGIYMDTDVRLVRGFDEVICNKGFVGVEKWGNINTGGGVGAVPNHPMIKEMLDYRLQASFLMSDGSFNVETNGFYETVPFMKHGMRIDNTLQVVNGMTVYPSKFFHPYDYMSCEKNIDNSTIAIHYFSGGWMNDEEKKNRMDTQKKYQAVLKRIMSDR